MSGFKCGIVGLPNVGKSTLFNALTSGKAEASNYPFCTIDPNIGMVPVPDSRLDFLLRAYDSKKKIPALLQIVDIAGLVRGASQGEGLGNQFLNHIRECEAVVHIVRCFEDENITHVEGGMDPLRDIHIIETELILKDLEVVERRLEKTQKDAKRDKELEIQLPGLVELRKVLDSGALASTLKASHPETLALPGLDLLTAKPVLFVANIGEGAVGSPDNPSVAQVRQYAAGRGDRTIALSARMEAEISQLSVEERGPFLESFGLKESGLDQLARAGYDLLGLMTFFTAGPKEIHAWTVQRGAKAPEAAGKIHTDFEKGFIRAEVFNFGDLEKLGSEAKVKEKGLYRVEGRDYPMADGDIVLFRFNV